MKGTFQGITGLVFKPVSGLLDATSKAAEGIKNTATSLDDKPNEKRERLLRVFYGIEKYYKTYEKSDAELNYYLRVEIKKGRFYNTTYLGGYILGDNNSKMLLLFTLEFLIYFNQKKMKKLWIIPTDNIDKVVKKDKSIDIYIKIKKKKSQV